MRIFATDLDGTLLDRDHRIRPRDAAAIRGALDRGILVTIATGRLTTGTAPYALELGLGAPLVCADGAVTARARAGRLERLRSMPAPRVAEVLAAIAELGLSRFVFLPHAILSCERGVPHHGYVGTWSPAISTHAGDALEAAFEQSPEGAVMLLAIGEPPAVERLLERVEHALAELDVLAFFLDFGRLRCARFIAKGVSKGEALAALAASVGARREDVAVVGDWKNDVSMFEWAGRSFSMAHAPDEVKDKATDVLPAREDGGGVAEAIEQWLADAP
jgi:hydroxymethylpyrimidine pyrophosphatase-like HAD family hydrolase